MPGGKNFFVFSQGRVTFIPASKINIKLSEGQIVLENGDLLMIDDVIYGVVIRDQVTELQDITMSPSSLPVPQVSAPKISTPRL